MKKRVRLVTSIVFFVLIVSMGTIGAANAQQATEEPQAGGTLHIFTDQTVGRVDPTTTQANYLQVIANQLFAQLVKYKTGSFDVQPDLAQSWTVSTDGLTYTFKMRPNLKFQDESPIQLSDVVFSLNYARRSDSVWAQSYAQVDQIKEDDANNAVVITLKSPDPFFLQKLSAIGGSAIYPQAEVTKYGDQFATTPENSVGSGPYQLVQKSQDDQVWKRFADFYQPGYIDTIDMRTIPDANTQLLEFTSGNEDWISSVLDAAQADQFKQDPTYANSYIEFHSPDAFWYGFNTKVKPFDDIRVRQAFIELMDMPQAVKAYGLGTPTTTLIHPQLPGYDPDFVAYTHNVDDAHKLLADAGYASGLSVDLYVWNIPAFVTMTEVIQQQLTDGGINVNLKIVDFGTYISEVRKGTYPFFINLGNIGVPDTAQWLYDSFDSKGSFNSGY